MRPSRIVAAGALAAATLGGAWPAGGCCDWTPQDEAFWRRMSEQPRTFSYETDARPSPHKLSVNGRERTLPAEPGGVHQFWHDVHRALPGAHSHDPAGRKPADGAGGSRARPRAEGRP
jgi:hypothetical protein